MGRNRNWTHTRPGACRVQSCVLQSRSFQLSEGGLQLRLQLENRSPPPPAQRLMEALHLHHGCSFFTGASSQLSAVLGKSLPIEDGHTVPASQVGQIYHNLKPQKRKKKVILSQFISKIRKVHREGPKLDKAVEQTPRISLLKNGVTSPFPLGPSTSTYIPGASGHSKQQELFLTKIKIHIVIQRII